MFIIYSSAPQSQLRFKRNSLLESITSPLSPPPLPSFLPPKSFYISTMVDRSFSFHVRIFFSLIARILMCITARLCTQTHSKLDYCCLRCCFHFWIAHGFRCTTFLTPSLLFINLIQLCGKVQYTNENTTAQIKSAVDNQTFSGSCLRAINKDWAVGGEVIYTHVQQSGGGTNSRISCLFFLTF